VGSFLFGIKKKRIRPIAILLNVYGGTPFFRKSGKKELSFEKYRLIGECFWMAVPDGYLTEKRGGLLNNETL